MEMRTGNLWKSIFLFSIPLMFTNLLQVLFNLADVAVVGKFAGPISLGAVGSTTLLIALTTAWLIGIGSGVNALTALYIGKDEKKSLKSCVHTGIILCLGMGLIILVISEVFAGDILRLLGTKEELISEANTYYRIYMLGAPALSLYDYGNSVLSAAGDTKKPLRYLTIAGVLNVLLNLLFVLGFDLKSTGVALASIIAQYLSAFLVLRALIKTDKDFGLNVHDIHCDKDMLFGIMKISIPSAMQYSLFAIANLFVQSAVNSFDHIYVEGNSAAANSDPVVYNMMAAFYTACTSFVAQNYGAGNKDRIKKTYLITTLYSFAVAFILGLMQLILRREFLLMFTSDEAVIRAGELRIMIMSLSYCLSSFMDNATAFCRGICKTVIPTIVVILGSVIFRIIWIYTIFAYYHTIQSLFLLYSFSWVLTALMGNTYLIRQYRRLKFN